MRFPPPLSTVLVCTIAILYGTAPALSGVHLWRVKEIFSNPEGTIQFIEIAVTMGSSTENGIGGHRLSSTTNSFTFPSNVVGSTANKHILLATRAFAALPGAPTPDHTIVDHFFSTTADTITFSAYDMLVFSQGQLPLDGTTSLNKDPNDSLDRTFTARNSPTNYAGETGSVSAVPGPPGVPDGTGSTTPVTVAPHAPDGSALRVSFDVTSCTSAAGHFILYGQRSGFPAAPGGTFTLLDGVCTLGTTSPYDWIGVPSAIDGSGLIWFVVVARDVSFVEGSWGVDSRGSERDGTGNNGASDVCALVKDTTNSCGHSSP